METFKAIIVFADRASDDVEVIDVQVSVLFTLEVLTLRFDMTEGFRVLDERDLIL